MSGYSEDPEKMLLMIKTEIASLKKSRRFIDYHESSNFAVKIDQLRIHITQNLLPNFPNQAVDLLRLFLDLHPKILEGADDSKGVIGDVFMKVCADLGQAYTEITTPLDDIEEFVFDRFMNNAYCICNDIILNFKTVLGNEGLNSIEQKLKQSYDSIKMNDPYNLTAQTIRNGLKQVADCQDDVTAYISACSYNTQPSTREHLEIAERFIKHCKGQEAIEWLDSMHLPHIQSEQNQKKNLKIQALELCGNCKEAQAERLHWFEETLIPDVYKEIVKYAEVHFIESFHKVAIKRALDFPDPHVAITFLVTIQEFEYLAQLVLLKSDILDGNKYNILRPAADILYELDPLAATLLYRKLIQAILVKTKSRYYYWAAKDLVTCGTLSSKITNWQQYQHHESYFLELSTQHKRKRSFWAEYQFSIDKQKY